MSYERKLLFIDGLSKEGISVLEQHKDLFEFQVLERITRRDLLEKIKDIEVLSVRTKTIVDQEIIRAGRKLKLIARAGTGVDHIDCDCAQTLGVAVMNTAAANSISAAELTIGLLIAAARQIPKAHDELKRGIWNPLLGMELHRKTAGIIGLGRIGRMVARRLQAFGMRVIAVDPYQTQDYADEVGVRLMKLDQVLSSSDFLCLHIPLNAGTKNLINSEKLGLIKAGAILINTARGGIVEEEALISALDAGHLRAYATDVFELEPPPKNHRFLTHPSIMVSPHMGAQTAEAQKRVNLAIASQIVRYFQTGEIESRIV